MKGMIFSEPMVKAWLEGRKMVTRRTSGLKEINKDPDRYEFIGMVSGPGTLHAAFRDKKTGDQILVRAPYRPGETVYIKETWADLRGMGFGNDPRTDKPFLAAYKADTKPGSDGDRARKDYGVKWKSPRFMLERASRSHALIKSVRPPERIREITEDEARLEGLTDERFWAIDEFYKLWNSLHGSWKGVYRRVRGKRTLIGYECYPFDKLDIPPIPARARKRNLPCTAYPNPWVWPIDLEKQ